MKQLIIIALLVLQASFLFAQQEKKYIKKGNEAYQAKNFKEAEANYRASVGKAAKTVQGNFNLGDALYKQKKYDEANAQFAKIAATSKDKQIQANAFHNIGNSFLTNRKLEESIAAYKKSLLKNPKDEQTRYNLAYAQKLLQKQKDDKKKNKDKNKDKDKDKNKDKDKKDGKNKDDKNKDNKDKKDDKDKKDQDKKNPDNKNGDNKNQQQQQPQPNNVSKDDAQRMLDALNNDEKATQDKLKNKKLKGERRKISKDW